MIAAVLVLLISTQGSFITLIWLMKFKTIQNKFRGHFYFSYCVFFHTQVTNKNKDTSLRWFKDGVAVTQVVYDQSSGVSTLTIPQVPKMSLLCSSWLLRVGRGVKSSAKCDSSFLNGGWRTERRRDKQAKRQLLLRGFLWFLFCIIVRFSQVHFGAYFTVNLEIKDDLKYLVVLWNYQYLIWEAMNMFNFNTVDGFPSGYEERGRFIQSCGVRWARRGCQHLRVTGWR